MQSFHCKRFAQLFGEVFISEPLTSHQALYGQRRGAVLPGGAPKEAACVSAMLLGLKDGVEWRVVGLGYMLR